MMSSYEQLTDILVKTYNTVGTNLISQFFINEDFQIQMSNMV